VAEICARLDGLPLAIELAAAQTRQFSPQALLARLDNRLSLLVDGAHEHAERQQTLRGTIDWSWSLLDADTQRLFSRLSVFVGGCTFEAAESICNAGGDLQIDVVDGLTSLVNKSLLRQEDGPEGEPRFGMLETIHEYARTCLHAGEQAELQHRHAAFFLALVEGAAPELEGRRQGIWLDRLEAETGNFRAALGWRGSTPEDDENKVRLATSLAVFWAKRGYVGEGRAWLEMLRDSRVTAALRAPALAALGTLAWLQGDHTHATTTHAQALALYEALGDQLGIATALRDIGTQAIHQGNYDQAKTYLEQSLALSRKLDDLRCTANTLLNLGLIAREQGDAALALSHYQESLRLYRQVDDVTGIASVTHNLGEVAQDKGHWTEAAAQYAESLAHFQASGHIWGIAYTMHKLATLAVAAGELARATGLLRGALLHMRDLGDRRGIAWCLESLAAIAGEERRAERAAQLWGAAAGIRDAIGTPMPPAERVEHERSVAMARAQLDPAVWNSAWATGQGMFLEQAIALALEDVSDA
jgi:tetratricopeptide (TPR) repeat protein